MNRRSAPRLVGLAALACLGTTVPAAEGAAAPKLLPSVDRTISAASAADRECSTAPRQGTGLTGTSYTAPRSGYLTTRLAGRGDWDLTLRESAKWGRVGASQGFGGREVVQTWIKKGQRVTAQGCRREGAGRTARVSFALLDVAVPKGLDAKVQVVKVTATTEQAKRLEEAGFDVTENVRDGYADVVTYGAADLARLRSTGLTTKVKIADVARHLRNTRRADASYARRMRASASAAAGGSELPSGRVEYRTYETIQNELKALVEQNPGLVKPVTFGRSFQGREQQGVEISNDVAAKDGKPVYFTMGVHHAREWPSGEAAMELANLLVKQRDDPRIRNILDTTRVVILPIVNPDGYVLSRNSFSPGDTLEKGDSENQLQDAESNVMLVEAVAPPGGFGAYRRKNCRAEGAPPELPCELAYGIDPNRNYGNGWGGPGSSSDVTSQSYHGPSPRSESETRGVWDYVRSRHVTNLVSIHSVAALVLRPPGTSDSGLAPDETAMKVLGDAMAKAAGYVSQFGWQLYDTTGTTEDDTYAATGGYGYTIEMGPTNGDFHEPFQVGVVNEWLGRNAATAAGGLQEALLLGAEEAGRERSHAVLTGKAPAGNVLRLTKQFDTVTSPYCEKSVEPLLSLEGLPEIPCATGDKPPLTLKDSMDTSTTVPASGQFAWHIGQSTRPFVNGGAVKEALTYDETPVATIAGTPAAPTAETPDSPGATVDYEFTLPADRPAQKLRVRLTASAPEDYDMDVIRKADGKPMGTSAGLPGSVEQVVIDKPAAGAYVVRVKYYAAATGAFEIVAQTANVKREVTTGSKEAYRLTCEKPDGTVLETQSLVIDRGQALDLSLGCGVKASSFGDGTPITGTPDAPLPAVTPSVSGTPAPPAAVGGKQPGPKPLTAKQKRAKRLKACKAKAKRVKGGKAKRQAAAKRCNRKFGPRKTTRRK